MPLWASTDLVFVFSLFPFSCCCFFFLVVVVVVSSFSLMLWVLRTHTLPVLRSPTDHNVSACRYAGNIVCLTRFNLSIGQKRVYQQRWAFSELKTSSMTVKTEIFDQNIY